MGKYRKKPVVIDAIWFEDDYGCLCSLGSPDFGFAPKVVHTNGKATA